MGDMIRTEGLVKRYGKVQALDGVPFAVEADEFVALLGSVSV